MRFALSAFAEALVLAFVVAALEAMLYVLSF